MIKDKLLMNDKYSSKGLWSFLKGIDRGGRKDVESLVPLKFSEVLEKLALQTKANKPMVVGQPLRGSGWATMCPRKEVIKHLLDRVEYEELDLKKLSIFAEGRSFEEVFRNSLTKNGFLWGDWQCESCGKKWITGDYEHDFGDGGVNGQSYGPKMYITEKTPNKHGTKCPTECDQCGGRDFKYIELEAYSDELFITMHPDGLMFVDENVKKIFSELRLGEWYILECKAIKDTYWKMTKNGPLTNESGFPWNHPHQTKPYKHFFGAYGIIYAYHNKNTHNTRFIIDERDNNELVDDLRNKGNSLRDSWEKMRVKGRKNFVFSDLPTYGVCSDIKCARKDCPEFANYCFYGKK